MFEKDMFFPRVTVSEIDIRDNIILHERVNISEAILKRALMHLMSLFFARTEDEKISLFQTPFIKCSYADGVEMAKRLYDEALAGGEKAANAALKLALFEEGCDSGVIMPDIGSYADDETVLFINKMAKRCRNFFTLDNKVIKCNFDFEGAYNQKVSGGRGDFLTKDGIWSISVTKMPPSEFEFIVLSAYYVLGQYCYDAAKFRKIKNLGVFNPRLCRAYSVNVAEVPRDITSALTRELV